MIAMSRVSVARTLRKSLVVARYARLHPYGPWFRSLNSCRAYSGTCATHAFWVFTSMTRCVHDCITITGESEPEIKQPNIKAGIICDKINITSMVMMCLHPSAVWTCFRDCVIVKIHLHYVACWAQALDINSGNFGDVNIRSDRVFDQETLILELGSCINVYARPWGWFVEFALDWPVNYLNYLIFCILFFIPGDRDGFAFAAYFSYGAVVYVNCDQQVCVCAHSCDDFVSWDRIADYLLAFNLTTAAANSGHSTRRRTHEVSCGGDIRDHPFQILHSPIGCLGVCWLVGAVDHWLVRLSAQSFPALGSRSTNRLFDGALGFDRLPQFDGTFVKFNRYLT